MLNFNINLQYDKTNKELLIQYKDEKMKFKDIKDSGDVGDSVESFIEIFDICEFEDTVE